MAQVSKAQNAQLKAIMRDLKRLQNRLQTIHKRTGYEDLAHGVLALKIAEHTVEETLEHTGLGGKIEHKPDRSAHRVAKRWLNSVKNLRTQGGMLFKSHPSEDLETALRALQIAESSLQEVAEHYE